MKITRSDSERLVIVDFLYGPVVVSLILMGAGTYFLIKLLSQPVRLPSDLVELLSAGGTVGGGIVFLTVYGKRCVFDFDLARQQLVWQRQCLFGREGGTLAFGRIICAQVQVNFSKTTDPNPGANASRLNIVTAGGDLPINPAYVSGQNCQAACDAINLALRVQRERVPLIRRRS
jgi:hypothetical protein